MAISEDRIFEISLAIIAFQLSISIAGIIMPNKPIAGATDLELLKIGLSNWTSWVGISVGLGSAIGGLVYRVPIGAVVYASIYGFGSIPVGATMSQMVEIFGTTSQATNILNGITGIIVSLITLLFVWTFIKLAR